MTMLLLVSLFMNGLFLAHVGATHKHSFFLFFIYLVIIVFLVSGLYVLGMLRGTPLV